MILYLFALGMYLDYVIRLLYSTGEWLCMYVCKCMCASVCVLDHSVLIGMHNYIILYHLAIILY